MATPLCSKTRGGATTRQWYPYFQEIHDGYDTLSWIEGQHWSNGKVGMFGTSYLASVQWLAALGQHPALKAIAPAMSPGNYYRDVAYPSGAFPCCRGPAGALGSWEAAPI